ncbi:uncharacterized protein [Oryza sativa Japonica Group]|uniref:Uncharacterized protein n=2 Tax=Oryza sativa subsp. japonica TaxID=39947 RepID=Q84R72_ORYSJ|nr:hypothetical protein [Oryza sativa Japonica Group]ABF98122.1 hypothetical protein LOC_Os03g46820 [Oryza sativa Japonica Group]
MWAELGAAIGGGSGGWSSGSLGPRGLQSSGQRRTELEEVEGAPAVADTRDDGGRSLGPRGWHEEGAPELGAAGGWDGGGQSSGNLGLRGLRSSGRRRTELEAAEGAFAATGVLDEGERSLGPGGGTRRGCRSSGLWEEGTAEGGAQGGGEVPIAVGARLVEAADGTPAASDARGGGGAVERAEDGGGRSSGYGGSARSHRRAARRGDGGGVRRDAAVPQRPSPSPSPLRSGADGQGSPPTGGTSLPLLRPRWLLSSIVVEDRKRGGGGKDGIRKRGSAAAGERRRRGVTARGEEGGGGGAALPV